MRCQRCFAPSGISHDDYFSRRVIFHFYNKVILFPPYFEPFRHMGECNAFPSIDLFSRDAVICLICGFHAAVHRLTPIKTEVFRDLLQLFLTHTFKLNKCRNPRPCVDSYFHSFKIPSLTLCFLVRFIVESYRKEKI